MVCVLVSCIDFLGSIFRNVRERLVCGLFLYVQDFHSLVYHVCMSSIYDVFRKFHVASVSSDILNVFFKVAFKCMSCLSYVFHRGFIAFQLVYSALAVHNQEKTTNNQRITSHKTVFINYMTTWRELMEPPPSSYQHVC